MPTASAKLLAILEANTAQFEARMSAAGVVFQRTASHGRVAAQGVRFLQAGMQQLAFTAVGVTGPAGRFASSLGLLALGGPVMTGILGGLAALGVAYKIVERSARAAEEAEEANRRSRDRRLARAHEFANIVGPIALSPAEQLATLVSQRGELRQMLAPPTDVVSQILGRPAPGAAVLDDVVRKGVEEGLRRITSMINTIAIELEKQAIAGRKAIVANQVDLLYGVGARNEAAIMAEEWDRATWLRGRWRDWTDLSQEGFIDRRRQREPFRPTAAWWVQSGLSLAQGSQLGVGGFLQSAGGVAASINPLAGAVIGGIGTIFSLFNRNEESRTQRVVEAIERQGEHIAKSVRIYVIDPRTGTVMQELTRAEEHDAVFRTTTLPGATG